MHEKAAGGMVLHFIKPDKVADFELVITKLKGSRIDRMSGAAAPAVAESKRLVDEMFSTVRDLSLGLRPSMLDDFGLQAALEWHVRDFMARYRIDVDLRMHDDLAVLSDKRRTCVYRVVQEAMTNCARHAGAAHITVDVNADNAGLRVSVRDDGVDSDPARRSNGLGLLGIDERGKELRGTLEIARGTSALHTTPTATKARIRTALGTSAASLAKPTMVAFAFRKEPHYKEHGGCA